MESYNNDNKHSEAEHPVHTDKPSRQKKTFLQRHKYHIRQICGVIVLVALVSGSAVLLTKCGSNIDDASSVAAADASVSESRSETSQTTTSQTTSETTAETTSETTSETTTTQTTTEETTTEAVTTEEPTTTQQTTTTAQPTTTTKQTTAAQTTTTTKATTAKTTTQASLPEPVGPAKIEKRNGITYVNGILIANKTYSLPANYNPGLDPNAQAAFNKMQQAASMEGINLWICSGFRSYSYQNYLYNSYVNQDGKAAADRYSARPGYSEHQTGLAMDINFAGSWFDNTSEAKWLAAHCTDYGFIIRYKPGKESSTGYMAESWHIRYLGNVQLCKSIEASGLSLEEYLGITSVYANP